MTKSTCTHHFKVLREAGVIRQRLEGTTRLNSLRREELEQRFPGLLDSVLRASGCSTLPRRTAVRLTRRLGAILRVVRRAVLVERLYALAGLLGPVEQP